MDFIEPSRCSHEIQEAKRHPSKREFFIMGGMFGGNEGSTAIRSREEMDMGTDKATKDQRWSRDVLMAAGVDEGTAGELAISYTPERVREVVRYCLFGRNHYGSGGVVSALREDWDLPPEADMERLEELLGDE